MAIILHNLYPPFIWVI
ncbi:unnamed protein product [Spirodela intermedia]|uniref:Uncharacterized protein n=1 Tax=Spirodela intermedia TaxID=51605 RepID=A0A7I8L3B9_SPIIN|nr:unnamed protein product [Spirodela intermedia]